MPEKPPDVSTSVPSPAPAADGPPSYPARLGAFLRREPVGGALLLVATVAALVWANTPAADAYAALRDTTVGPAALHLDLTLGTWAADGLLAIFFFVVGLELKQEFVTGELRDPRRSLVPIAAAVAGVVLPAVLYLLVVTATGSGGAEGWAIPAATDIAFAVAVLAVVGRGLPASVRLFLLTLAVVDDLIAITIIAIGYTGDLAPLPLVLALVPLVVFAVLTRHGVTAWWLLVPLAVVCWVLVHESGVHATVAGVLLGLVVPARTLAPRLEHRWRPFSTGVAVPVFAFLAAGVTVGGPAGLGGALTDGIALGVVVGLVVGKPLGILAGAFLVTRLPGVVLGEGLRWPDVAALGLLAGIGFTVSLLVGELAFGGGTLTDDHVKVGVLCGSTVAAVLGAVAVTLRRRARDRARCSDSPSPTRRETLTDRG